MSLDIVKELGFYAAYHWDFYNQVIHIVCIPMILWSVFVVLAFYSWPKSSTFWPANLSTLALGMYGVYYVMFDPVVGSIAALFYLILWYLANLLVMQEKAKGGSNLVKKGTSVKIAFVAHVFGWAMQVFVGHVIEGKKPALFDSLFQAFSMAPLFVIYECLFMLGFKQDLHHQIELEVKKTHAAWKVSKL